MTKTPHDGAAHQVESDRWQLTCIDLFSGCGGFSLGLQWAGLECLAAIDLNESAIQTFRNNHPKVPHVLVRDLTRYGPEDLETLLGTRQVDVIVGGPPCQGFSRARQADGANHGIRLVEDSRRELYKEYLRFVAHFRPRVFIMENVPGIKSAAGGEFFTRLQVESRKLDYRVVPFEVEAWRFGVPQKRVRQFVIGTHRDLPLFVVDRYIRATHAAPDVEALEEGLQPAVTLGEAIGDLPPIKAGDDAHERPYDQELRDLHVARYGVRYVHGVVNANKASILTGHAARMHSLRDLRDFARLGEGETSRAAIARGIQMEFPYDRESFKDRYTRQHRDRLCSTIVAHLKKDGLMFIHPTQLRSLTPREAARVQTFPDTFVLPRERTNAFAQIGNAVPPLVGKALGHAVQQYLAAARSTAPATRMPAVPLPASRIAAIEFLEEFIDAPFTRPIACLGRDEFLQVWWTVAYLHPHLHPDASLDNGRAVSRGTRRDVSFVIEPVYVRSGWPVALMPIVQEARRRFDVGLLGEDEYYCSAAIMAGESVRGVCADVATANKEYGEQECM